MGAYAPRELSHLLLDDRHICRELLLCVDPRRGHRGRHGVDAGEPLVRVPILRAAEEEGGVPWYIASRARKSVGKERSCVSGSAGGGTVREGKWCFHDELRVSPLLKSVPLGVLPLPQGREGRRSVPREPFCARHGRPNANPPSPFSRRPSPLRLRHFQGGGGIRRCQNAKKKGGWEGEWR